MRILVEPGSQCRAVLRVSPCRVVDAGYAVKPAHYAAPQNIAPSPPVHSLNDVSVTVAVTSR